MKNIPFDMDGVLVDYEPSIRVSHIATALGRSKAEVRAAIYDSGIEAAADAGYLGAEEYLYALGEAVGLSLPADVWVEARRQATQVRPGLVERLSSLVL